MGEIRCASAEQLMLAKEFRPQRVSTIEFSIEIKALPKEEFRPFAEAFIAMHDPTC